MGDGVLGPLEEATEVKEDCDPAWELDADPIELTRGDEAPEEYAWCGVGKGNDGTLSWFINDDRWLGMLYNEASFEPGFCTCEIDGKSSFTVLSTRKLEVEVRCVRVGQLR